jgi:hypothetical protein
MNGHEIKKMVNDWPVEMLDRQVNFAAPTAGKFRVTHCVELKNNSKEIILSGHLLMPDGKLPPESP